MDIIQHSIAVGKYLVSPLIKDLDDGRFAASVSIRSGRGSGMHDRVMRFTPRFVSRAVTSYLAVITTARALSNTRACAMETSRRGRCSIFAFSAARASAGDAIVVSLN